MIKNFIKFSDFSFKEYLNIFKRTDFLKSNRYIDLFKGKKMIILFDKPSTRTRLSFEMGFKEEGGIVTFLNSKDTQISRGESLKDSAKIISSLCDIVVIRTFKQKYIEKFSRYSSVPVINALTNEYHPCQVVSDIYTFFKKLDILSLKEISKKVVTWVGDYNNVLKTWIVASKIFRFKIRAVLPKGIILRKQQDKLFLFSNIYDSLKDSDLLITDTWFSMGDDNSKDLISFKGLTITNSMLNSLNKNSYFTHCLPAHEGQEIEKGVLDNKKSIVWDVVFNKLHTQKSIVDYLLTTLY